MDNREYKSRIGSAIGCFIVVGMVAVFVAGFVNEIIFLGKGNISMDYLLGLVLTILAMFFVIKPSSIIIREHDVVYAPQFRDSIAIEFSQFEAMKASKYSFKFAIMKILLGVWAYMFWPSVSFFLFGNYRLVYKEGDKVKKIPVLTYRIHDIEKLWNEILYRKALENGDIVQKPHTSDNQSLLASQQDSKMLSDGKSIALDPQLEKSYGKNRRNWLLVIWGILCFLDFIILLLAEYDSVVNGEATIVYWFVRNFVDSIIAALFLPIAFAPIFIIVFIAKKLSGGKPGVPNYVYLCDSYLQIDDMKYLWKEMSNAKMVNPESKRDKYIEFTYFDRKYRYAFGAYRLFSKADCTQYKEIADFCQYHGFYFHK